MVHHRSTIPSLSEEQLTKLKIFASEMALVFHVPIYLVGSSLRKRSPRDYDIRVNLTDKDFSERWYPARKWMREGETGLWTESRWVWASHCVHWWERGCKFTELNLDVQVEPKCYANQFAKLPKFKLA